MMVSNVGALKRMKHTDYLQSFLTLHNKLESTIFRRTTREHTEKEIQADEKRAALFQKDKKNDDVDNVVNNTQAF